MGDFAGGDSFVSRVDSGALAYAITGRVPRPYRSIARNQRTWHYGVGRSSLAWNTHQSQLSLAVTPFSYRCFRSTSHGQDETRQRIPHGEPCSFCHWSASLCVSARGWAVVLLSPRAHSGPGILLDSASFAAAARSLSLSGAGSGHRML